MEVTFSKMNNVQFVFPWHRPRLRVISCIFRYIFVPGFRKMSEDQKKSCTDCSHCMSMNDNTFVCVVCEECFCAGCVQNVSEDDHPELCLTYDFAEDVFCATCASELPEKVTTMTAKERMEAADYKSVLHVHTEAYLSRRPM